MLNILAQIIFLFLSDKNNCYNQEEDTHFLCFTQEILLEFAQDVSAVSRMLKVFLPCKVKIREDKNHSTRIGT